MDFFSFQQTLADPQLLRTQSYIDGLWVNAHDGSSFAVDDPARGDVVAQVADCGEPETLQAIEAARRAFPLWRARTAKDRAGVLRRWFDLIQGASADLAAIMTLEQGKPVAEALGEVAFGASFVEWFAEQAKRVEGDTLASPSADKRMLVFREPIGVCAAITPWNFPLAMITRKVAPALAAGCSIILKPAEQTPLTALALVALAHRAGIPPGTFNVVTAGEQRSIEVGKALCASPVVRKLSFTGSTPVGRILMKQSAPSIKKLSLELGGLAPFIVFDDADISAAVEGAIIAKYRNAGQTCICPNRFYVHAKVYDDFVARLSERTANIQVGGGFEEGTLQGPLIDDAALAKVDLHVQDAITKGATLMTGGKAHALGGRFYEPTVLAGVDNSMLCMNEETFGPVAPVIRFENETEVVQKANDTEFGLASYFYSRDVGRIFRVAEALEYGMVGVNTSLITNEVGPFGGVKQSGLGREGSSYGIDEYLEMKYVCLGGI